MNKKRIIIVVIPTIILMIIATIVTIAVLYVATDSFKSYDELFAKYLSQNEELLDILKNEALDEQKKLKQENSYLVNGKLNINIQKETNSQTINAVTSSRYDNANNRTYSEITLKNGESNLIKLSYINSADVYAIKCEDILANYIGIRNSDLKTFLRNMGMSEENIKNIPNTINIEEFENLKITDDEIKYIKNKYFPIIIRNISKNKYTKSSKNQLSIDGVDYVANAYVVSIDNNTLNNIAKECLHTLKEDEKIYEILNRICKICLENEDIEKKQYIKLIDNMITELEQKEQQEGNIEITIYEYKGTTIRTKINFYDNTKLYIDKLGQEKSKKIIVTVEQTGSTSSINLNNGETEIDITKSTMQISIEKVSTKTEIVQKIVINPNTNNMAQKIVIDTSFGRNINGSINNNSIVSVTTSDNGDNNKIIEATYNQSIQVYSQIEEIMELKNSNTVIVNNYTKDQLMPFFQNISNQAKKILPNKLEQLGVDIGRNQNEDINNDLEINVGNKNKDIDNLMKTISVVGTGGFAIANVNSVCIENIEMICFTELICYYYNEYMRILNAT